MAQTWQTVLEEVLGACLSSKLSFVVDDRAITIASTAAGAPVHFTLSAAIAAAENVFMGLTGEFAVGSVCVTIGPAPPSGTSATPESVALATAIATLPTAFTVRAASAASAAPASHTEP